MNDKDLDKICQELSSFEGGTIELTKDEETQIAIMVINNPARKNSFTGSMMVRLRYVLDELEKWTTGKALIIHGAGNFFCSGGDLVMVKQILNQKGGELMSELMKSNFTRLQNLNLITLCVVEGRAIGGGAELLTICDFRLATRSAQIGFVHKKLGITTGWSGGIRLVNLVGKNKALDLLLFGRQLTAEEAKNYGLINDVLEDSERFEDILNQAKLWLSKYIDGSNTTIKAIKMIVNAASNCGTIEEALDVELKCFQSVWGKEAHMNALKQNIKHR